MSGKEGGAVFLKIWLCLAKQVMQKLKRGFAALEAFKTHLPVFERTNSFYSKTVLKYYLSDKIT